MKKRVKYGKWLVDTREYPWIPECNLEKLHDSSAGKKHKKKQGTGTRDERRIWFNGIKVQCRVEERGN